MSRKSSMIPLPASGSSISSKLVVGLVGLALFAIVVRYPGEAAGWARSVFGWLVGVVDGLASFIRKA